jgi:alkylation response protein AidB-like acyl-CoA dehydrogenase
MGTEIATSRPGDTKRFDAIEAARELGPALAQRAAAHDANDSFVADSYADFKARKLFSAGVPAPLGGGGATYPELCTMLQEIGRCCGSSALALSMHTHQIAMTVWQWKHGMPAAKAAAESLLSRVGAEELILVSSGGSDWLEGSGKAEKVDGGFRVDARKIFASGSPSGQLLLTTAVYDDPVTGATVLHLPVPLDGPGVRIHDNWRTMGMRATGSNDITIERVFVPDHAVGVRRPKGKWHEFFDVHAPVVWPLVMSVYVGVAEAARTLTLGQAPKRWDDPIVQGLVGEMETNLAGAQLALREMVALANDYDFAPSIDRSNKVYMYKTIAARSALRAVELAMEVRGGGSFFRDAGIERFFRDIQGARFHPWQERRQYVFTGRIALGLEPT